ncbi:alpha-N-arabinofuranosidase protein [Halorhabdus tiamatea SARL4B]|uniref:Alpha-L-arabinofuranosidase, family GH51 n=1 Tax=Halorhabdus tiamatea SARL4B TaxID=1033806 RepID=F7PQL1_9EURY|nr:alpha-L-arabinofuranosidase [Halorhabdus tiamatea]ERJ05597.1 alpha-N-arabinofuranosidase protein [Halorhabdus tiamatea SARL4B]CCQ35010.1 alpha-L-arabinofuranosidase, family GH51 [Halorhabdus tiamatea SARL4B]
MTTDSSDSGNELGGSSVDVSRRTFLAAQSAVAAGSVVGLGAGTAAGKSEEMIQNTVSIDTSEQADQEVPDTLFGRLHEFYGDATIYPTAYSLHVKNPTFYRTVDTWAEDWAEDMGAFISVERDDVLPFPWQQVGGDDVRFEHRTDGEQVAGGQVQDEGVGYPRITVDGGNRGGIHQKTVLPDFRTLEYNLGLSVRGSVDAVRVSITTLDGETLASTDVPVSEEWTRHEPTLELSEASGDKHNGPLGLIEHEHVPYGEYAVEFTADADGHFDIDFIEFAAADAIEGPQTGAPFNPTTIQLLQDQHNTWLKWPGGNVTSQYNWEDGIGPLAERTPRFNHAWGGIQPNYFGTAEYLDLCALADQTPEITVGWHDNAAEWAAEREILPEDAANWVAYVNGSTDTEYGARRADHGYDDPWNVEHWGVGNEVWGSWQFGHTPDPSEYATGSNDRIGFETYSRAMREVDDSISIIASGWDPAEAEHNETPWNETLFDELDDDLLDGVNIHRYQWGLDSIDAVKSWKDEHDADNIDYNEVMVMAATQLGNQLEGVAAMATEHGQDDCYINLSELGIFPQVDTEQAAPYPGPETMPGGAYVAGALNALIRLSDSVRWAAQTWVPVVMGPTSETPLRPDGIVTRLYATLFKGDDTWYSVGVSSSGASRDLPNTGPRVNPAEDMPYVDGAAMQNGDDDLAVFVINRNLRTSSDVTVEVGEDYAGHAVEVVKLGPASSERPLPHSFRKSYEAPSNATVKQMTTSVGDDGTMTVELEPAGVARLYVSADPDTVKSVGDHGAWGGMTYPDIQLQTLAGGDGLPRDPNGDGLLTDVNGDGDVDIADVRALLWNRTHPAVTDQPALFDFDDDGTVTVDDVLALLRDIY